MNSKVAAFEDYLISKIEEEQRLRTAFNDDYLRYLPGKLKSSISHPPTRFEIYPKVKNAK